MRDLYRRLGVHPGATRDEVARAIARSGPGLAEDAGAALLDVKNREVYDANHRVLTQIAQLRAALELNGGPHWQGDAAQDFSRPAPPRPAPAPPRAAAVPPTPAKSVPWPLSTLGVIVAFYLGTIGIDYLTSKLKPARPPSPNLAALTKPSVQVPPQQAWVPPSAPQRPVFDAQELPAPKSGLIKGIARRERIAPLKIESDGADHHLVKLVDSLSGAPVATIFVRAGSTVEVKLPLGAFRLRYAAGERWYGEELLFGPTTSYSQSETVFSFERDAQGVKGYSVKLYKVANGNMHTEPIGAAEF